jgi:hypothetical protein
MDNKKNTVIFIAIFGARWSVSSFFGLFSLFFATLSGEAEGTQG